MAEKYTGVKFQIGKNALEKRPAAESNMDIVREMILCAKILSRFGWAPANAGNISARIKDGMLIKATGCEMGNLKPGDFTLVKEIDLEKFILKKAIGLKTPSSETPMHYLIYKERKDVNSVIHVHDEALLKKEVYEKLKINCTKREFPYGSKESAEAAFKVLRNKKIAILKNHGVVSVGVGVGDAMQNILEAHERILRL
ncbi:MAG: class II aldolase/adducin family protein [Candidatus Micrarchaeota archaeon]|nr:class II aldolase/adducin family protein [Candidatus Micrarchaeota archaeon]